ncbi:replication initiation protein [Tenacibaculum finnmarkense]|uniref:replication initiation protein n=1 Tax=Tenacibaculum finnmarkense TaxID=2781243 RepID=UPI00187BB5D6|nr:replication initiation protein [Tenacibaculum finnmarkense]MBE7649155.1 RepB family plasmid replication initiator protein [Tenacibaculum finnmarkense genomovar ulcerans]
MKKQTYIVQSNQVVLSKICLSNIYQQRLLNAFIDSISPFLKGKIAQVKDLNDGIHFKEEVEFASTINQAVLFTYRLADIEPNHQNYKRLMAAADKLLTTVISVTSTEGGVFKSPLLQSCHLDPGGSTFQVKISTEAFQFLSDLSKGYSMKSFKTSLHLKTIYSACIYELLCKWRNKNQFQIDVDEIMFISNAPNSYSTNDFKKRVLDAAKKELDASEFADLSFTYEDIKVGRSIKSFKIFIKRTNKDTLETNKLIKQASPRHDFDKEIIDFLNRNDINFNGANRELFKEFFKLNGTNNGLDELEKMKDSAMRNSRNSPQAYMIGAVKKNIIDTLEKREQKAQDELNKKRNSGTKNVQTDILTQLAQQKSGNY